MRFIFILIPLMMFAGCCSSQHCAKEDSSEHNSAQKTNAALAENKSYIFGKVITSYKARGGDFLLKVKVLQVQSDGNISSIAVVGEEYLLAPSFILNENGEREDNEQNKMLALAGELATGDSVKGIITMKLEKGWFFTELGKATK